MEVNIIPGVFLFIMLQTFGLPVIVEATFCFDVSGFQPGVLASGVFSQPNWDFANLNGISIFPSL